MTDVAPAGLGRLTAEVAAVLDSGGNIDTVTSGIAAAMTRALQREDLVPLFLGRQKSFGAFVDPDRHFIVHCSVHQPGHVTEAHDHGEAWAVYGVVRGKSRYRRYRRGDDAAPGRATLIPERNVELLPGETDIVLPGEVHLVANETTQLAWNVVVRPRPIEHVWRRRFDAQSGTYTIHPHSRRRPASSPTGREGGAR